MTLRSVRLLEALMTATKTEATYQNDDTLIALADFIMDSYGLDTSAREIVLDTVQGKVAAVKAVKAIKAIAAMYEDEA